MSLIGKSVYHVHDVNKIQFGNVVDEKSEKLIKIGKSGGKSGILKKDDPPREFQ